MKQTAWVIVSMLAAGSLQAESALSSKTAAVPALSESDLLQWTAGLAMVIVLILLSAWILRRLNQFSLAHGNRLRVLGGIAVGSRERVVLLQVGEKQLLLGVAPGRVQTLYVLPTDELTRGAADYPTESMPTAFAERFKQAVRES